MLGLGFDVDGWIPTYVVSNLMYQFGRRTLDEA